MARNKTPTSSSDANTSPETKKPSAAKDTSSSAKTSASTAQPKTEQPKAGSAQNKAAVAPKVAEIKTSPISDPALDKKPQIEAKPAPSSTSTPSQPPKAAVEGKAETAGNTVNTATKDAPQKQAEPVKSQPESSKVKPHQLHDDDEYEIVEAHSGSFAGKALTALLLLIAGGGLALWGGPKVAPHLPKGMAPVAEFLSKNTDNSEALTAEIEALRGELEGKIAEVSKSIPQIPEIDVTEQVTTLVGEQTSALSEEFSTLKDQLSSIDGQAVEGRLAEVETVLEGLKGTITSLNVEAGGEADVFQASVDGLKAEIASIAEKTGQLSQKIDEVASSSVRQVEEARQKAEAEAEAARQKAEAEAQAAREAAEAEVTQATKQAALADIGAAIENGSAFDGAIAKLNDLGVSIPEGLSAASAGLMTHEALQNQYEDAAFAAIGAATKATGSQGGFSGLGALVSSQFRSLPSGAVEGNTPEAVLSRVKAALEGGDIQSAASELNGLPSESREAISDWISALESRAAAQAGYVELKETLAQATQ